MKQTAVEWLRAKMLIECLEPSDELFEQAKEMHKQEIIDAWNDVGADGVTTGKEYYINKFKSE